MTRSTLLGELQLGQGLRRCYTPIYGAIIPQIETFVKSKERFSRCYFKRHLTDELGTERTGSCPPLLTRILRFSTSSQQTPLNKPLRASQPSPTGSPRFLHVAHT